MLHIIYGEYEPVIFNPKIYFDNTYESNWITQQFSKDIIKDIDKSIVLSETIIESPVLGTIPPEKLSGGVKTLILINNVPDIIFNATMCGSNCSKWLLELGKIKDITINLRYLMDFGRADLDNNPDYKIHIVNTNKIIDNVRDLVMEAILLV